mgnify:CR=1 FL=1
MKKAGDKMEKKDFDLLEKFPQRLAKAVATEQAEIVRINGEEASGRGASIYYGRCGERVRLTVRRPATGATNVWRVSSSIPAPSSSPCRSPSTRLPGT